MTDEEKKAFAEMVDSSSTGKDFILGPYQTAILASDAELKRLQSQLCAAREAVRSKVIDALNRHQAPMEACQDVVDSIDAALSSYSSAPCLHAALRARVEVLEKVAEAAVVLCDKLEIIHNYPEYQAVWMLYSSHIPGGYKGPKYTDELNELRRRLENEGK